MDIYNAFNDDGKKLCLFSPKTIIQLPLTVISGSSSIMLY